MFRFERSLDRTTLQPQDVDLLDSLQGGLVVVKREPVQDGGMIPWQLR